MLCISGCGQAGDAPRKRSGGINRELKKSVALCEGVPSKMNLNILFLDSFEQMYGIAERVAERMELSGCPALYAAEAGRGVCSTGL